MMRRPPREGRISPRRHEAAFTFIAPRGFAHPKTRAHVRLLGPCYKTGRMDPYDRQRPERVVREHRPNDRQQSQSTASSPPQSTTGRKDGTLATRGTRCKTASVGPESREPGCNSPEPRPQTYLPRHLRHPVPTHADARPREVRRRARDGHETAVRSDPQAPRRPQAAG